VTPRFPGESESAWLARRAAKIRREAADRASQGAPKTQAELDAEKDAREEALPAPARMLRGFLGLDEGYAERKKRKALAERPDPAKEKK
jgi:hypothetical protein